MNWIRTKFIQGFSFLLIQVMAYTTSCFSMNPDFLDDVDPRRIVIVKTPMPGKIMKIFVTLDQIVKKGDILYIIEAMKMQITIRSDSEGKVKQVLHKINENIEGGASLITLNGGLFTPLLLRTVSTPPDGLNPPPLPHGINTTGDEKAQNKTKEKAENWKDARVLTLRTKLIPLSFSTFLEKNVKESDPPSLQAILFPSTASISAPPTNPYEVKGGKAKHDLTAGIILKNALPTENTLFSASQPLSPGSKSGLQIFPFLKIKNHVCEDLDDQPECYSLTGSKCLGGIIILLTLALTYLVKDHRLKRLQRRALQRQSSFLPIIKHLHAVDFNGHPYITYQPAYNINLPPKYSMKAA